MTDDEFANAKKQVLAQGATTFDARSDDDLYASSLEQPTRGKLVYFSLAGVLGIAAIAAGMYALLADRTNEASEDVLWTSETQDSFSHEDKIEQANHAEPVTSSTEEGEEAAATAAAEAEAAVAAVEDAIAAAEAEAAGRAIREVGAGAQLGPSENRPALGPRQASPTNNFRASLAQNYPSRALRDGLEGQVEVELLVAPTGRVSACNVLRSSGHAVLDTAACEGMMRSARFEPALGNDGTPVEGSFRTSMEYRLSR
ncbi:energy transducer TonB [Qipengyuania sp. 902]|uniref:energy transducer TonB n=1 Tax=Qipengyuania sp. 902 TaxID=3417565 RepID=UPI003EB9B937